jgi:hypothetical protein
MSRFACTIYSRTHLSDCDSARPLDTPCDQFSSVARAQAFGSVIGLLRPRRFVFLDKLHPAPVDYLHLTAACAENDQGCPP